MINNAANTPVVMCISSVDPTGGGGVAADIETLSSLGCHCAPIVASIIARDTQSISDCWDIDSTILVQQARAVLEDMDVKSIKIGMLASVENIETIHTILTDYPYLSVILDPAFYTGSDVREALVEATRTLLIPQTKIAVLNHEQLRLLAPEADSLQASARVLLDRGCEHVFVSGPPNHARQIANHLFTDRGMGKRFEWPNVEHQFVGAGNTLSASIAAYLAHQDSVLDAVEQGQKFTWKSLNAGRRLGMGNWLPNRIFWSR